MLPDGCSQRVAVVPPRPAALSSPRGHDPAGDRASDSHSRCPRLDCRGGGRARGGLDCRRLARPAPPRPRCGVGGDPASAVAASRRPARLTQPCPAPLLAPPHLRRFRLQRAASPSTAEGHSEWTLWCRSLDPRYPVSLHRVMALAPPIRLTYHPVTFHSPSRGGNDAPRPGLLPTGCEEPADGDPGPYARERTTTIGQAGCSLA